MKSKLIAALALTAAVAAPSFAFAQSANGGTTRAQVKAELVQLERAGYNPSQNDNYYPNNLQNAEHRVANGQVGNAR